VRNVAGNVMGMMPHPEHAAEEGLPGGCDGLVVLGSLLDFLEKPR
jgi:phosphoribosylformylglycinamidine (FGAM) synthase-like amidotransferase family enzyme